MRIACLGWGSLIWKWHPLRLSSPWFNDGPVLPVEFARESDGGELATVLCPGAAEIAVFWALVDGDDLDTACEQLRVREGIPVDRTDAIGVVPPRSGHASKACSEPIASWAKAKHIDAVIWTALPPRSDGVEGRAPDADEAVKYLTSLRGAAAAHAEDYIRRVPPEISTRNRLEIARKLGWTHR